MVIMSFTYIHMPSYSLRSISSVPRHSVKPLILVECLPKTSTLSLRFVLLEFAVLDWNTYYLDKTFTEMHESYAETDPELLEQMEEDILAELELKSKNQDPVEELRERVREEMSRLHSEENVLEEDAEPLLGEQSSIHFLPLFRTPSTPEPCRHVVRLVERKPAATRIRSSESLKNLFPDPPTAMSSHFFNHLLNPSDAS